MINDTLSNNNMYLGREQTLVKHFILRKYLERFAHIVGKFADTICYIDCFSGPWNARSDKFEDSSFAIALDELRKARDTYMKMNRKLNLHCFFLEKAPAAYEKLKEYADSIIDVKVCTKNAELEQSVSDILGFVKHSGSNSFPFVFIDPTGWTGFEMKTIAPLLQLNPGEVLINFMTSHIRRFIDSPEKQTHESFERLFGSNDFVNRIKGLSQQDREDATLHAYIHNVKATGNYSYVCKAIVLHPEIDRTHFHLIYATRNIKGVKVFKEAEKKAMELMEVERGKARQRKQFGRTGQFDLFDSQVMHNPNYYNSLRDRYLSKSRDLLMKVIQSKVSILYDEAYVLALSEPLTWESDLKDWIQDWCHNNVIEVRGMESRQRVPKLKACNYLVLKSA